MLRTCEDIIRIFKYLLLKSYFKLSDRCLVERTKTDLLFKYFLGYDPEETKLMNPSLLTVFRRERLKDDTHIAQMDYMKTEEFKTLYKERYKIEAKNAELKNNYNYGKANAYGELGITIQGATTLFLTNMKRIIKLNE